MSLQRLTRRFLFAAGSALLFGAYASKAEAGLNIALKNSLVQTPGGGSSFFQSVIDTTTTNNYTYVARGNLPGESSHFGSVIQRIDPHTLNVVGTIPAPNNYIIGGAAFIDVANEFAYFAGATNASPGATALIFQVDINPTHTFQIIRTLSLTNTLVGGQPSGLSLVTSAVFDPSRLVGIIGGQRCDVVDCSGSQHVPAALKMDLNPASPTFGAQLGSTLVLDPTFQFALVGSCVVDSGRQLTYFSLWNTGGARGEIVKADISGGQFILQGAPKLLNAGESPQYDAAVLDNSGNIILGIPDGDNGSNMVVFDSNFNRLVTLNIPGATITRAAIDNINNFAYFYSPLRKADSACSLAVPCLARVFQLNTLNWQLWDTLDLQNTDTGSWSFVIDPSVPALYLGATDTQQDTYYKLTMDGINRQLLIGISPTSANTGSASIPLTINALNLTFQPGAIVYWDDQPLTITSFSTTQLIVNVPSSLLATPGVVGVQVLNPDGHLSNAVAFSVIPPPISVTVTPQTINLDAGQLQGFNANVQFDSSNSGVTWAFSPTVGSTAALDAFNVNYTAPGLIASAQNVMLTATSVADPTKSNAATIHLNPISIGLLPAAVTLNGGQTQVFAVMVQHDPSSSGVNWTLSPASGAGTFNAATRTYTAPATISAPQTVTLTATSIKDPSQSASATITLQPLTVTVAPATKNLHAGNTAAFAATVLGAQTDLTVTWSIGSDPGTLAADPSDPSNPNKIQYTAPAGPIAAAQTVTLQATSNQDHLTMSSATITLLPPLTVSVTPPTTQLRANQTQRFTAAASNFIADPTVAWSLTPNVGAIDSSGRYTAPASIAAQQTVTVRATSNEDSSQSATALITLLPAMTLTISPNTVNLDGGQAQAFTATVQYDPSNSGVVWTLAPTNPGTLATIDPFDANYVAPGIIASAQTVTLTATSIADATVTQSATIQLFPIAVSLSPASVLLRAGQTQVLTPMVTHDPSNSGVSWSLNPNNVGVFDPATRTYTAPTTITAQQSVTITAASIKDPSRTASTLITLLPPIVVNVNPQAVTLGPNETQAFTDTVSNFETDGTVTWSVSQGPGSVNASGLYTAPVSIVTTLTAKVRATSNEDPSKFDEATITLVPKADLKITQTASPATVYTGKPIQYSFTITNIGPSPVTGTTVSDLLPAEVAYVGSTIASTDGVCSASGNSLACTLTRTMNAGDQITFNVNVTAVQTGSQASIPNTVDIDPPTGVVDPNLSNNSATTSVTILEAPYLFKIIVTPDNKIIGLQDLLPLKAQAFDQYNNDITDQVTLSWSSDNPAGSISATGAQGTFRVTLAVQGYQMFTVTAASVNTHRQTIQGTAHVTVINAPSATGDICGSHAYPVPWKPSLGVNHITFSHLAPNTTIRIFTTDARRVQQLESSFGENVVWDLKDDDGKRVASGVYLTIIDQANGSCPTEHGKIVVIQ